ncbi:MULTISPECIES: hypothetical protein [Desulfovibrio]|uniref:Uncharacterized protein n=1 Tax=Desulfovibrio desulfuricans TaxID=876 RepID=A0AA94L376_DESDE|nr:MULTISPECIES: hypothetical protein [Desulfovibrio]SFW67417.1 hypothetical protein SAMN02910291_02431 [Desulfovibrio desulfuricans]SPD37028.1 Hypothetical protein DSVG11_3000 [Desulfovibrio sp. G11]
MPQPLRTFTYYVAYANYLIMVLMLVIVRVFLLMVPALAVGTVAFADVLFLLLYKHTIAVNRHNKTGFSFKNNSLCAETTKDQRILKCADGRRDRLVHLAHVNKNTFAVIAVRLRVKKKVQNLNAMWYKEFAKNFATQGDFGHESP